MLLPPCPKNYLLPPAFYSICVHCSISNKIAGPIKLQWCQSNNCWNSKLGLYVYGWFLFHTLNYLHSWSKQLTIKSHLRDCLALWGWIYKNPSRRCGWGSSPGLIYSFEQISLDRLFTCPDEGQRQLCQGTSGVSQPLARELRRWPRMLSLVLWLVLQSQLRKGRWEWVR